MIQICTIGGYNEVGKNMTAVKVEDEAIILDMGLHLDSYIRYTNDEDVKALTAAELRKVGAIPNDSVINDWKSKVKAIVPTHAHLDHVGALPFISNDYNAPIICTPFTREVITAIVQDEKLKLNNQMITLNLNSSYKIPSKNIKIEFINMTHSTPQTAMVALHTSKGIILYANDFKFDNQPIIGSKPNYKRLEELGKKGILALIVDGTGAERNIKTPSENVAREMLRDVMLGTGSTGKAVIVTTFSSHLARLKSIVEFGKKMNRKIIFLGRSLAKYVQAGENIGLINFSKDVEIVKYSAKIKKRLKKLGKEGTDKYLIVCTGHQGEPKATLSKMATNELSFPFKPEDHIIFSCKVIPSEINIQNRKTLEKNLNSRHVRIFKDIHTSGHASREDLRDLINLTKPKHIIPAHGDKNMIKALADLAVEKGYKLGDTVHIMSNGEKLILKP